MKWLDIYDIAIELSMQHAQVDPRYINFVDLQKWVTALDGFDDDVNGCNERILEAIQAEWIKEVA